MMNLKQRLGRLLECARAHVIDDFGQALHWSSVRLHLAAATLGLVYVAMPVLDPSIAAMLPAPLQAKAIGAYAILGLALRVTNLKPNA